MNYEQSLHPERPSLDLTTKKWLQQHFPAEISVRQSGSPQQRNGEERGAHTPVFHETGWLPARVPGDVRHALISDAEYPDLMVGRNSVMWEWVEKQEWWQRCHFRLPQSLARAEGRLQLCVDGVTAPATFWLNGDLIGKAAIPRHHYRFDLPGQIDPRMDQVLAVRFDAPLDAPPVTFPAMATAEEPAWDGSWPRFMPIGLFQGVRIEALPVLRLEDAILNYEFSKDFETVKLKIALNLSTDKSIGDRIHMRFSVTEAATGKVADRMEGSAPWRTPTKSVELSWSQPNLWWPQGLGKATLYRLDCEVTAGNLGDKWSTLFGLRDIQHEGANIRINGRSVFLRTALWIPSDLGSLHTDEKDYRKELLALRAAGFNSVRLWSGAPIEKDAFFGCCDELGLLVDYEFDSSRITEEAITETVRRLRYHPSLMAWTESDGRVPVINKEILSDDPEPNPRSIPRDTNTKKIVTGLAPHTLFAGGGESAGASCAIGVEGPPRRASMEGFVPEEERWPPGPVHEHHALHPDRYGVAGMSGSNFEEQIWSASLYQAVICQSLAERERMQAGRRAGLALWRWNEPWPCGSYGLTEPNGTPKVACYWLKRVMQPVAVLIEDEGPVIQDYNEAEARVFLQNQGAQPLPPLEIQVQWLSKDGILDAESWTSKRLEVESKQQIATVHHTIPASGFLMLRARLLFKERVLAESIHPYTNKAWATIASAMQPVTADADAGGRKCSIKAVSRPLLCIEIPGDTGSPYADNFFTLAENEERTIRL